MQEPSEQHHHDYSIPLRGHWFAASALRGIKVPEPGYGLLEVLRRGAEVCGQDPP